ncbi:MAG: hypothetical protein Q4B54_02215 [Coriobacteriales bacterium]|nr:hypothetical protein [Coriobacteriales bacterium]
MRIVKEQALAALSQELRLLDAQSQRCQREMNKFSGFCLQDMAGSSVTAAEQRMRMQASVAQAHLGFCRDLCVADRKSEQLVLALPTTSPGVLDTHVAQERVDEACGRIRELERCLDRDLTLALRTMAAGNPGSVNMSAIRMHYSPLIESQRKIMATNEGILDQALAFERAVADVYAGVNTNYLVQATASAERFAQDGSWGSTTWAGQLRLETRASAYQSSLAAKENSVAEQFLRGDLKTDAALYSDDWQGQGDYAGLVVSSGFTGSVMGFAAELEPYMRERSKQGDPKTQEQDGKRAADKDCTLGAKAEVEANVAEFCFTNDAGAVQLDNKTELLTAMARGVLGASLYKGESFAPALSASAKAEAALASDTVKLQVGEKHYNLHGKAELEALTASAKAGVGFGDDQGVSINAGAGAYLVSGELTGGFTLLGVDVDLSVEGDLGGAGAKAGLQGGLSSISGELGLGLGIGAGVRLKVDWSGAAEAAADSWDALESWWNGLHEDKAIVNEEE